MVQQSKREELLAAWRALAGDQKEEGWRTIPIAIGGPCHFLAGRHFPGNEEALIVGFDSMPAPTTRQLPEGRGFLITSASLPGNSTHHIWIALSRQSAGSLDLFALMADDVITMLQSIRASSNERLFNLFLARIKAWQDFMRDTGDGTLSPEAEVGLFGELAFLHDLIAAGLSPMVAVEAWQGPLGGIQDFMLGRGAIEVKSTVSINGFAATIGSLEQLDDSQTNPLFLAGIRLSTTASGTTLPEQVAQLQRLMQAEPTAIDLFGTRLLHAGFIEGNAKRHNRRFSRVSTRLLRVSDGFPRLIRANVTSGIKRARYEIDIDLILASDLEIEHVLEELGGRAWN